MKQYKKPTRDQKEVLSAYGYEPAEWRFVKMVEQDYMEFVSLETKEHIFLDGKKRG